MEKREIATAPPRRPQGRRTPRPPVDGGSVSPTRSTSYLSRSSSWQNFNVLNPRDSGLHKCLQRFSKSTNQSVAYSASTKILSAAARGNCGKLENGLQGKALPGSYQTQLKLLSLRRGNHQAPLRRRNGANSRRGAPFHTTPSRRQPRVVSRSSMHSLLRGRLGDPRKIRCDLLGGTCGFNNSTCFSP